MYQFTSTCCECENITHFPELLRESRYCAIISTRNNGLDARQSFPVSSFSSKDSRILSYHDSEYVLNEVTIFRNWYVPNSYLTCGLINADPEALYPPKLAEVFLRDYI